MKCLKRAAGNIIIMFAVVFLSCCISYAGYEVDDLMGNGFTSQWMVINSNRETYGGKFDEPLEITTDLINSDSETDVIQVQNGNSDEDISERELHVLFLLLSQGYGEMYMNYKAEDLDFDVSTPNLSLNTIYNVNSTPYASQKEARGQPDGDYDASWRQYFFQIGRQNDQYVYDTTVQAFNFHQNPKKAVSQTIVRPIVISNVYPGTAHDEPLILRMTLRDSATNNGNIVAYDRATWDMTDDKTVGDNNWVFVPVDDLVTDNKRINYYLTTEVVNHTSVRYAAATYDSYGTYDYPDEWKFDLLRTQGTTDIDRSFYLARTSHIPPGLVSVFKRTYNVNEQNKTPLRLYPIDTPDLGEYKLRLNHRVIFGKTLGETYKQAASEGGFNLFEITPFRPKPVSMNFYDRIKEITQSNRTVEAPNNQIFYSSAVKRDDSIPGIGNITQFFTIDQNIPSNLRNETTEGVLPLHITFNIPVTLVNDREWWNNMVNQWRKSGRIEDIFAEKYEIFLLTETDGEINPWNLSQELQNHTHDGKNYYNDQIKVFYDEERSKPGTDNDKGLITVSFIVMLMDGTRDGVRPELSMVDDYSISQENDYIVIRDGNQDNKWKMTFFIAPAGTRDNPTSGSSVNGGDGNLKSYGSSGCNFGMGAVCFAVLFALVLTKKR